MTSRYLNSESPWLLALLASLVALGPLSVDMYLPALPAMGRALGTEPAGMHLTLSAYLTGFAAFHLFCGPLADRFGRKPVLTLGIGLFVIGCLGCALSRSLESLLVFRVVQGVGACVGPTLARAVVRDLFKPHAAARALSLIAMLMALAPAIAPSLGGVLLLWLPWPSIFVFLALYGICITLFLQRYLRESLPVVQSLHPVTIVRNYLALCRDPFFLSVTTASGMIYAGLMAYLASSSYIYIEMLGVPVELFGLIFLTAVIGYALGSALSARLSGRYHSEQIFFAGILITVSATAATLLGGLIWPDSVAALMLPMIFYSTGMGLVLPHSMTIALRPFPHMAGTASALLGFIQMSFSAVASACAGLILTDSPLPVLLSMLAITLTALLFGTRVNLLFQSSNA